jgi:hypothetical protein
MRLRPDRLANDINRRLQMVVFSGVNDEDVLPYSTSSALSISVEEIAGRGAAFY